MKSILLSQNKDAIRRVYDNEQILHLKENASLVTDKIFNKNDILSGEYDFSDTEYIFSTWGMPAFSEEEIRTFFPCLKCVFYAAGSVQSFARNFLNCGIKVFSAWAANSIPVAEFTVAQILLANKGYFLLSRTNGIEKYAENKTKFASYIGNYDSNIGIIGAGMIGKKVIELLKPYKLNILVFDPFLPDEKAKELSVKKVSLEVLFSSCNVISNHLANNEKTKGILNYSLFKKMIPNSTFINTGRGAQVVEPELLKVLKSRSDITALLDVTWPEPPVEDSAFYSLDNCFITPHIAGSSGNEVHRMAKYMVDEFDAYIGGMDTKYSVDLKMLETMA